MDRQIKIALVDDHILLRSALAQTIDQFEGCKVVFQASNGQELLDAKKAGLEIDLILLDLNMPGMDGFQTAQYFSKNFPKVYILMLTMYDSELALIRLVQAGARGFLKKDIHPVELKNAISCVMEAGYYYSNQSTGRIMNLFKNANSKGSSMQKNLLNDQEIDFLSKVCTDLTYKEIAEVMRMNPRSVDNLRDNLFNKLDVKSRVGLAMFSIKNGIVTLV